MKPQVDEWDVRRRPLGDRALRGPAAQPRQRDRPPVVRDVELVHEPDDRPDRAVLEERRVREAGLRAAQAPRREGRAPPPRRTRRQPDRAHRRAGRVHRRAGRRGRTSPTTTATRTAGRCAAETPAGRPRRDPAERDRAAREPFVGPGRPARERHRLADRGRVRDRGVGRAHRGAEAPASPPLRQAGHRGRAGRALAGPEPRAGARAPARSGSSAASPASAPGGRRSQAPRRESAGSRRSAGSRSESASAVAPARTTRGCRAAP